MIFSSFLALLMAYAVHAAPTTTTFAKPEVNIYESQEDLQQGIRPFFDCPLNRDEAARVLQRAMDMLRHQPGPSRGRNFTEEAKILLRRMTCDPNIGSSSGDSSQEKEPAKKQEPNQDENPCIIETSDGGRRKVLDSTKKRILMLHDERNATIATIRAQYPWFQKSHLERFRSSCSGGEASQQTRIQQINEYVRDSSRYHPRSSTTT